jgi:triosephosphate isomerase
MTKRYLIANWKLNLPPEGIESYLRAIAGAVVDSSVTVVVAPPYPYLRDLHSVVTGAQNCSSEQSGAFTGEVSPAMLRDLGARYVIIGHSERRNIFGESEGLVARKLGLALETGLTPVFCIGEDLRTRDAGHAASFLADQVRAAAVAQLAGEREVIIAYEPVWAIGTGRNASGDVCAETSRAIREALVRFWPSHHASAPILYGGSVTPDNVDDLVSCGEIDGFLVGGASLDSGKMLRIAARLGQPGRTDGPV